MVLMLRASHLSTPMLSWFVLLGACEVNSGVEPPPPHMSDMPDAMMESRMPTSMPPDSGVDTDTVGGEPDDAKSDNPDGSKSSSDEEDCERAEFRDVDSCFAVVGESFCSDGGLHDDQEPETSWTNNPPHSGNHYSEWHKPWGIASEAVPRPNWVHNLEHGGVVILLNCPKGCAEERAQLEKVVELRPDIYFVVTEDSELPKNVRFAAISWTWVHTFNEVDLDELLCFADQHERNAPEEPF